MQYNTRSLSVAALSALTLTTNAFMVPRNDKYALQGFPGAERAVYAAHAVRAATPVATPPTTPAAGGSSGSAVTTFPESSGSSQLSEPMTVTAFDGGMKAFGRGVDCTGQDEGGDSDAVFEVADGGSLSNVIIAADQTEGVHCAGECTIENVWWVAVCEDALSFKGNAGNSQVKGGGAKGAEDKVIQHNGGGSVTISNFYVEDFGKLYRSCGNCDEMYERHVTMSGIVAKGGKELAGINSNFGDTATITDSCATDVDDICVEFNGTDNNDEEPTEKGSGPSSACKYSQSDVGAC